MRTHLIVIPVLTICGLLGGVCQAQPSGQDHTSEVCSKIQAEKFPTKAENSKTPSVACKGSHSVTLSWKGGGSPQGETERYSIYRWKSGGLCQKIAQQIEKTIYEDCTIEAGQTYRYSVTALKDNRESDPSNVVEAFIPQP